MPMAMAGALRGEFVVRGQASVYQQHGRQESPWNGEHQREGYYLEDEFQNDADGRLVFHQKGAQFLEQVAQEQQGAQGHHPQGRNTQQLAGNVSVKDLHAVKPCRRFCPKAADKSITRTEQSVSFPGGKEELDGRMEIRAAGEKGCGMLFSFLFVPGCRAVFPAAGEACRSGISE